MVNDGQGEISTGNRGIPGNAVFHQQDQEHQGTLCFLLKSDSPLSRFPFAILFLAQKFVLWSLTWRRRGYTTPKSLNPVVTQSGRSLTGFFDRTLKTSHPLLDQSLC